MTLLAVTKRQVMNGYREGKQLDTNKPRAAHFEYRNGEWYFQTPEGIELGPFERHADAAVSLNEYLDFVSSGNISGLKDLYKRYAA